MRQGRLTTSMAARLSVALGMMLLPVAGVAIVGVTAFEASGGVIEEFQREIIAESEPIDEARDLLVQAEEAAEDYVEKGDRSAASEFLVLKGRIDDAFHGFAVFNTPTERRLATEALASWEQASAVAVDVVSAKGTPSLHALDEFHDSLDHASNLLADVYSLYGAEIGEHVAVLQGHERRQLLASLAILIVSSIAAVILASRLRRSITAPLRSLEQAATEFASDNLSHRVPFESDDELGRVARAFNAMAAIVGEQQATLSATAETQRRAVESLERSERTKEESLSLLRATLESTADGILVVDHAGKVVDFNRKFVDMWAIPESIVESRDVDEVLAQVPDQLSDPDAFLAKVHDLYRNPEASSSDILVFKDGRIFERYSQPQMMSGNPVGRVWSFRDMTEQKRLEANLRQSQKMDAIGQLAGGVAHDFNNLLSVIQNYAMFVADTLDEQDPRREDVEEIRTAAGRATSLTRQLLTFSRREVVQPTVLDPNEAVAEVTKLLGRTLKKNIALCVTTSREVSQVEIDPGSLHQVLMNLAINASDAMPDGGTLTLETRNVTFAVQRQLPTGTLLPGDYVSIAVADTGCGIRPETLERIFEPFFTTKPRGAGTGLGLATVYGIIEQAGGNIRVDSQPGLGTTFELYLPVAATEVPTDEAAENERASGGCGQTVLVVEDEDGVRGVVYRVLSTNGYKVVTASSGSEALDLLAREGQEIDLVLTDIIMPGISGRELAARIAELLPDLPVAFMSGYEDVVVPERAVQVHSYLLKPFTADELLGKIEQALHGIPSLC